jgi:hypothetical protein
MKISGFTMVRNADKYYFPIKESILSILPIVDEFIVALGNCDDNDRTETLIRSINSDKIKIFHRRWNEKKYIDGLIFKEETDFALSNCTGDWCFYLQADEIIHENDLDYIKSKCIEYLDNKNVEGFLFNYYHFWGDYNHYLPFHGWYKNEIRIIRNNNHINSYKDAQSFRKSDNHKLQVKPINAYIYHYGWVRPPNIMQSKRKEQHSMHHGIDETNNFFLKKENYFDYGALGKIPLFKGSHPKVTCDLLKNFDWENQLNYTKKANTKTEKVKHEKLKYKILSFIENKIFGGNQLFGYSNWIKV